MLAAPKEEYGQQNDHCLLVNHHCHYLSLSLIFGFSFLEGREDGKETGIPPLALTLKGEAVRCPVGEERGFFLASHGDVDVETTTVLEADSGCIAIAETLQKKSLVGFSDIPYSLPVHLP